MTESDDMSMHASADALPPTHSTNTTLIAYLCTYHGYGVRRIEGIPGRQRIFVLDRAIEPTLAARFYTSRERALLDCHRQLKLALAT
jgi:hypothetical protein